MLDDHRQLVDDLTRDFAGRLSEGARDRAIGLAVVQYGKDRPLARVTDLTAAPLGADAAQLPLPPGWEIGASQALMIEHPIGCIPPRTIANHTWATLITPTGPQIGLPAGARVGGIFRLTWTQPHAVDDVVDTIPAQDREAVAQYAAALLLDQVATMVSGDGSPTIKSDSVDHGEKGPNYAKRAETARARYHELLGIDRKRTRPASVTVSRPLPASTGGERLLNRGHRGW